MVRSLAPVTLPPKPRVLADTVTVGSLASCNPEVPKVSALDPVKVKFPEILPAPRPASVRAPPEVLLSVPPEIENVPAPRAPSAFRMRVPPETEIPAEKALLPDRMS